VTLTDYRNSSLNRWLRGRRASDGTVFLGGADGFSRSGHYFQLDQVHRSAQHAEAKSISIVVRVGKLVFAYR